MKDWISVKLFRFCQFWIPTNPENPSNPSAFCRNLQLFCIFDQLQFAASFTNCSSFLYRTSNWTSPKWGHTRVSKLPTKTVETLKFMFEKSWCNIKSSKSPQKTPGVQQKHRQQSRQITVPEDAASTPISCVCQCFGHVNFFQFCA